MDPSPATLGLLLSSLIAMGIAAFTIYLIADTLRDRRDHPEMPFRNWDEVLGKIAVGLAVLWIDGILFAICSIFVFGQAVHYQDQVAIAYPAVAGTILAAVLMVMPFLSFGLYDWSRDMGIDRWRARREFQQAGLNESV